MVRFTRTRAALGYLTFLWLYLAGAPGVPAQTAGATKSMLWRVESDTSVLYLLGSVHILPKSMYPLAPSIERAYDSSSRIAFELNLDSINQMSGAMGLLLKGMYTDGRTLKGVLSKPTYRRLEKRLRGLGMDISMFQRFKPWMVAFTLMGLDAKEGGMEAEHGIDMYFHGRAAEDDKPVSGLETVDDQVGVFSELSEKAQEKFLVQMLDNKGGSREMELILKSWKQGDGAPLEKLLAQYMKTDAALYENLVFRRNRNWIPQIEAMLKSGERCMVVVGTLHLVGEGGVVDLLRKKGYRVEQL